MVPYIAYLPGARNNIFLFSLSEEAKVQHLDNELCKHHAFKRSYENETVQLYKCGTLLIHPSGTGKPPEVKRYEEAIQWLHTEGGENREMMTSTFSLKHYFPSRRTTFQPKKIDVIVVTDSVWKAVHQSSDNAARGPRVDARYLTELTFKIERDVESTTPRWDSVERLNGYTRSPNLPDFIKTATDTPRRAENDNDKATAKLVLLQFIKNKYRDLPGIDIDAVLRKLCSDTDDALPYVHDHPELDHYARAFRYVKYRYRQTNLAPVANIQDRLVLDNAKHLVFGDFQEYWEMYISNSQCTYDNKFPFLIIVEEDVEGHVATCKYEPRPDAAFLKDKFPYFLAEVDSLNNQYDRYRLFVQMACALKFALAFPQNARKEFFLMGAFFSKEWEIHRYFFYVDGDKKTCFHEEIFRMRDASEFVTFLYEFYNYANYVKDDDSGNNVTEEVIAGLVRYAMEEKLESLLSKARSKKRTRSQAGHDDTNHVQSQGPNIRSAMLDALQKSRFKMRCYDDEFRPLVELPAHIVEATSPEGKLVIAKLPRKNSDELSLLQELSSQKSSHNHVIPLLDTVPSNLGRLIILPFETRLSLYTFPWNRLQGGPAQLSRELIEGIAFLHRQKIAHLDIKPANLVYSFNIKRLYIIDFDLAMRCKDVDETVELSCGTPGWSAPEIVHDDKKPLSVFSPIRADLWSCGKVLWSICQSTGEEDSHVVRLTSLLMDSEPRRRPLLHHHKKMHVLIREYMTI